MSISRVGSRPDSQELPYLGSRSPSPELPDSALGDGSRSSSPTGRVPRGRLFIRDGGPSVRGGTSSPVNSASARLQAIAQESLNRQLESAIASDLGVTNIEQLLQAKAVPQAPLGTISVEDGAVQMAILRCADRDRVVQLLMNAKATFNQASEGGVGTLGLALREKCSETMIRLLVDAKADVTDGVIHCAELNRASPQVMEILLQAQSGGTVDASSAQPAAPEAASQQLARQLEAAIPFPNEDLIRALLDAGARPMPNTLYLALINKRSEDIILRLLDLGARYNMQLTQRDQDILRGRYSDVTVDRLAAVSLRREPDVVGWPPRSSNRGFFALLGCCCGGIWSCIRSIFASIARLLFGSSYDSDSDDD